MPRKSLPRHVAIIMDGNGRWAQSRKLDRVEGHREGARSVRAIVETARRLGVRYLTLYAFSTENWGRPTAEVRSLMELLGEYLEDELKEMMDQQIRLRAIGSLDQLPGPTREKLEKTMRATRRNRRMDLILALSYGGRQEILDAVNSAVRARNGNAGKSSITEAGLRRHFYAPDVPDPDLVIRTSGELRLSNFLLWQSAYSELYVTETLWPDFREKEFKGALRAYEKRERRFGLTREQVTA
ncbi:MAG: isoprenyl transferase [Nitrospirae bacterium]|nr:isoprenyl transferase [Nitrospirota bacterium]